VTDTIETKILKAAGNKRKLEAMVISKGSSLCWSCQNLSQLMFKQQTGKFGAVGKDGEVLLGRESKGKAKSVEEMAKELLELDSEEITLASKDDRVIR